MATSFKREEFYRVGHQNYPQGAVVVTSCDENGNETTQTHTLEEWQDLQNTQSSQSS